LLTVRRFQNPWDTGISDNGTGGSELDQGGNPADGMFNSALPPPVQKVAAPAGGMDVDEGVAA